MPSYIAQVEVSADGQIWQAVEARETVDIGGVLPQDWFDAREAAQEIGATPGTQVRVLVWPADHVDDGTPSGAIYTDEHTVESQHEFEFEPSGRCPQCGYTAEHESHIGVTPSS
jgi:hypothetical protein